MRQEPLNHERDAKSEEKPASEPCNASQPSAYKPFFKSTCLLITFSPLLISTGYARIVAGEMDVQNVKLEVVVKNGALINIAEGGAAAMNIASNIGVPVRDVKRSVYIDGNVVNKSDGTGRKSTVNIGVISCEGEYR